MKRAEAAKVKVVLDSDVIIHFIKGECLNLLPQILPTYSFIILDIVYNRELAASHRVILQNIVRLLKTISIVTWEPGKEERQEFMRLQKQFGLGESAAMAYCNFHNDVLASSNLKDIVEYCEENNITYFTTMDFLYQALHKGILSEEQCDEFINCVLAQDSKLPVTRMSDFKPRITL